MSGSSAFAFERVVFDEQGGSIGGPGGTNHGVSLDHPARVAIGGVDAAGKTTLADELVEPLEALGRPMIRASVDGFHRPRAERYRRGADSPEGYYHDSFDYVSLRDELLSDASDSRLKPEEQLGPGGSLHCCTATFDYRTDDFLYKPLQTAPSNAVLLFDDVFLLRPELNDLWDFRIFLDVGFEVSVERAVERNAESMESKEALRERYEQRYVPGQRLYLDSVKPQELADVVVDNGDVGNLDLILIKGLRDGMWFDKLSEESESGDIPTKESDTTNVN